VSVFGGTFFVESWARANPEIAKQQVKRKMRFKITEIWKDYSKTTEILKIM